MSSWDKKLGCVTEVERRFASHPIAQMRLLADVLLSPFIKIIVICNGCLSFNIVANFIDYCPCCDKIKVI
jgi:hypothetical protein